MPKKSHLTEKERYQIELLVQAGEGVREIGRRLGRDGAVISRELKRSGSGDRYDGRLAHGAQGDRPHATCFGMAVSSGIRPQYHESKNHGRHRLGLKRHWFNPVTGGRVS